MMLRDEVWLSITAETGGAGVLCRADMERRLRRPLTRADMMPPPDEAHRGDRKADRTRSRVDSDPPPLPSVGSAYDLQNHNPLRPPAAAGASRQPRYDRTATALPPATNPPARAKSVE